MDYGLANNLIPASHYVSGIRLLASPQLIQCKCLSQNTAEKAYCTTTELYYLVEYKMPI